MTQREISILFVIISLVFAVVFFGYILISRRNSRKKSVTLNYKSNKKNYLYFLYKIYNKIPVINRYFAKMKVRLETLYPADAIAINAKATKNMTLSLVAAVLCGGTILILCQGDVFFIGIALLLTYVLFTGALSLSIEQMEGKLDNQFANFLTDVRHYYHDTGDPADAVYATLDECPYEIGLHINKIYKVLTATDCSKEVAKYVDIAPNRFLMMFAAICSTIKEYGDKRLEDGQWLFLNNINYLKDELNVEILKKKRNNYLFSGLKFVAIAPMFLLKPIEIWALKNMPDLKDFYEGSGGTITMAVVFALTMMAYQMICNLKDGRVDEFKESKLLDKITELPIIRRILTAEVNRNYSKSLRIGDNLKMVGKRIGPKTFLLKRILFGIVMVLLFNVVVVLAQARTKENLITKFDEAYSNSIVPNKEYRTNMQELSVTYMEACARMNIGTSEQEKQALVSEIRNKEGINKTFAEEMANEIMARLDRYYNIYYKWYLLIGCIAAATVGFYVPYWILLYQISIMKMSMEDEVVQFQTLALILMHVDGVTIDTLLEWMDRFAFCFKDSIAECIINLEYSIKRALEKMKAREPFPPFKRYVDNLLSIDDVGMVSAFDEIESEREFYKKKREQDNEIISNQKASQGKMIAYVPLIAVVGGYMILPFLIMSLNMMSTMNSAITQIM